MFKIWKFLLFFLFCLVIGLLFNLPIQQVLPHVKLPEDVDLIGMDGTLLNGQAAELRINQFPLRAIKYRYMPSCIPLLKICYRVQYERGNLQIAFDLLNGDTEVTAVELDYQVPELNQILPEFVAQPVGGLTFLIDELILIDGKPIELNGKLIWRDLGIDDHGIKISAGDFQIDFTGNPQQYDFKLFTLESHLDVVGKGQIKANRTYAYDMRIESEIGIDPQVKNVLELVGRRIGFNKYRVERQGRLAPTLIRLLFE